MSVDEPTSVRVEFLGRHDIEGHFSRLAGSGYWWSGVVSLPDPDPGVPKAQQLRRRVSIGLRLGKSRDGRLVVTGLTVEPRASSYRRGDDELRARMLRELPLGELLADLARAEKARPDSDLFKLGFQPFAGRKVRRPRRGSPGADPQGYQHIAAVWLDALAFNPRNYVQTVARRLGCSLSQARAYRRKCVEMGLLPPVKA
jgi:hypothetical protein